MFYERSLRAFLNSQLYKITLHIGIEQFANPFPLAIGQGLFKGTEQLVEIEIAGAEGILEGIEFTLQRIEAGALGAARQLAAGAIDGGREGLAAILLPQSLHQLTHKVVDGSAVLLAIGILDTQPLEQTLHGRRQAILLHGLRHRLGLGTAAKQLTAQLEGD